MIHQNTAKITDQKESDLLVTVRTQDLLNYIRRKISQPDHRRERCFHPQLDPDAPPDWHLILRQGLRTPLHINLGIPGIEEPEHPIEENPAALYAAMILNLPSIRVIFSGEIERAHQEGLIGVKALNKLRKRIRELI